MTDVVVRSRASGEVWRWVAASALIVVFALQLARVVHVWSATWDEPHHLFDGYTVATRGDYRLNTEVPPLLKVAAALPLLGERLHVPARPSHDDAFRQGRAFVFGNGTTRTLIPARGVCALFAIALALAVGWAAWRRFGAVAGLTALALFTFDPTVIANGPLVTTDIASALFIFAAVMAFHRAGRPPTRLAWTLLAGLLAGCAMATKFTGLLLAPMLLLLAVWGGAAARDPRRLVGRLAQVAITGAVAWVTIWAFYRFSYAPGPALSPPLADYLKTLPGKADAQALGLAARFHLLPEPYLWGLANTKATEFADTSYLFGHVYRHGPWWYFPAAFMIKSTLPLLILLAASPWLLGKRWPMASYRSLILPPVVYFIAVSSSHFDIGVRHLLPIYPFLYVVAAGAAAALAERRRFGVAAAAVLIAWQVVTCLRSWPAYMAYGNEAWGGPSQVHRYLSDANVDWGQQLKAVKVYLDARGENEAGRCWFAYFPDGAIEPGDYGVNCSRLPTTDNLWWLNLPMQVPPVVGGAVLISDSDLEGIEFGDGELNPYNDFRRLHPDAVIQGGVGVYHGRFAVPLAAALVQVRESSRLQTSADVAGARRLATSAAALAPRSAIAQVRLAEALAASRDREGAYTHFVIARELVRTVRSDLQASDLRSKIEAGLKSITK